MPWPQPAPGTDLERPGNPHRRWWFRLLALVAIPPLLLALVEGFLRLAGYGYPVDFFQQRRIAEREVWTSNPDFGRRFFPPGLVRYAQPFAAPVVKKPNSLRVFVLGESAAMGDPDFKFGLPRMLQVLLRERFPDRQVEVINAAMVAINSNVILPIARDCARRQGDLWVIYMGNNEIVGPFGSASVFGARAPALPLIRADLWLNQMRLGQLLSAAQYLVRKGSRPLPEWGGMEMMSEQRVRYDSPSTKTVLRNFQRNLTDILATGKQAQVPMILCTVATNLRDCAPFASLHRAGLGSEALAQWQKAYDSGVSQQQNGSLTEALVSYERAARIDDDFADLAFRQGQCCELLGQNTDAANFFRKARDRDALQFRADGRINETLRQSATASATNKVSLVDAAELFAASSPQGLTGNEYFYEHVHLTPEGNYLLARGVAEQAEVALSLKPARQWVSSQECLRLLGFTDWNRYDALNTIQDRIQKAPFTEQVDHQRQLQRIDTQLERYRLATKPAQLKREAEQVSQLASRYPDDPDLRWNLAALLEGAGENTRAEEQWRTLLTLQPQSALPAFNLARLLDEMSRQPEALTFYQQCLRINPEYYPAQYALGSLCLKMGRLPEAIQHLKLAIQQKPAAIEARLELGRALARAQRPAQAEKQFLEVLRLDPGNELAQGQLKGIQQQH